MIPIMLGLLGLILGSFVNALVWRLKNNKDWVKERSECTHCHHVLGFWDLIPVFSWVLLRGRCRYCRKPIEDSPLVELSLAVLFIGSYFFWPLDLVGVGLVQFCFWVLFLTGFLALAVYDLKWFLLPDKIVFPLIALGILQVLVVSAYQGDLRPILNALGAVAVTSGIFYVLFQLSRGAWIGGGDVKLGIILGILAGGVIEGFMVLFFASIAGLLVALPMVLQGKASRKTHLPFGPLLILGVIIVVLFGRQILNWYTGLIYA